MPEGQYTGDRAKYVYTSDDGTKYKLYMDVTLATIEGTGLVADTPESGAVNKPTKFKPRVVYWQGILSNQLRRKSLVCEANSTLYTAKTQTVLEIDGVTGVTTGRRGETLSY